LFCDTCDGCGVKKETVQLYTNEGKVRTRNWNENDEKFTDFQDKDIK